MTATTPEQLHELWTNAFARRDVDALIELYEAGGGLVSARRARLRAALGEILALEPRLQVSVERMVRTQELVVRFSNWRLVGIDSEGKPVRMQGSTRDVLRRQADGGWLMVPAQPFVGSVCRAR